MLVDRSVRDLLAAFGSNDPTPGGGSASALASAVGASLLMMVAGLPKTRTGSDEDQAALQAATQALSGLRQSLTEAIDADTAAYESVVAAYRMPKASVDEQQERKRAIQRALGQAAVVAAHGNRAAASDVGVAAALLRAGAAGARLNVETNLDGIGDGGYRETARAEVRGLTEAVERLYLDVGASLDVSV